MKNKAKATIIFILGIIVSISMNVAAEAILSSNSVSYFNSKTNETTVGGALDELFSAIEISNQIGDMTKIANIGDGTITGAINTLKSDLETTNSAVDEMNNNILKMKLFSITNDNIQIDTGGTQYSYDDILSEAVLTDYKLIVYRGASSRWVDGYITNAVNYEPQRYFILYSNVKQPYTLHFAVFY